MTDPGTGPVRRRPDAIQLWRRHRARWALPLVIIVVIGLVAVIDHLGSRRIARVDAQDTTSLVAAQGGAAAVDLDQPWSGFNPNTPAGAASSTTALLSSVLPSAYVINAKLVPEVNSNLLVSVETTSTSPLTIQYVISPKAVWSDGVPVSADDFIYAWQSQRGIGVDVDGQPDQVASTLGYRDIASVVGSQDGKTVTVTFSTPYTDWRDLFDGMVPAHIAKRVGWSTGFDQFNPAVDLSAGPYLLHSVAPGGTAVLVRNPSWWGTPGVLRQVTVTVAHHPSAWVGDLSAGNQVAADVTDFGLGTLNQVSSLPNTQSVLKPSLSSLELDFDVTSPLMRHTATRQAVAHLIDQTALLDHTFGSVDPDLVVSQDHLATPDQSSYQPSSAAGEYSTPDPAVADHLLRTVGIHRDDSGRYVDADGHQLNLRIAVESGDPWIGQVAAEIADELRTAGIAVTLTTVDGTSGLAEAAANDSYDLALVTRTFTPFATATAPWYSDTGGFVGSDQSQDWSKFDDPEVDALFSQASQELDPVAGGTIYAQIDDQLWDQMVALPLFAEPALVVNGVQLSGVTYNPSSDGIFWNLPLWADLKPGPVAKS